MKFGIFDYIDRRDEPLPHTYDERMTLLQAAEEAGFYGYHVTEHHATPLSATPSPAVFLAAAARETKRLRLGALLFLLPLYHPFRLLEELYMLDNLSRGRLDIGLGRGVSPFEFAAFGEDLKASESVYAETLDIIRNGLTQSRLEHQGKRYRFDGVPMVMQWVQKPHPPLWYGLRSGPEGSLLPARTRDECSHLGEQRTRDAGDRALPRRLGGACARAKEERLRHGRTANWHGAWYVHRRHRCGSRAPRTSCL